MAQRVSDGRVLRLIEAMLKAGSYGEGRLFPTERGTPQGGVASPLLSNILLTPFDREMRRKGYQLTRYADDWVITCESAAEARAALAAASRILKELGVRSIRRRRGLCTSGKDSSFSGTRSSGSQANSPATRQDQERYPIGALMPIPGRNRSSHFKDQVRRSRSATLR